MQQRYNVTVLASAKKTILQIGKSNPKCFIVNNNYYYGLMTIIISIII